MIVGQSKSQQEIDTQIDRVADEFRKGGSSEEIHELGRDGDRNSGGLGDIRRGGWISGSSPRSASSGGGCEGKEERPKRKEEEIITLGRCDQS